MRLTSSSSGNACWPLLLLVLMAASPAMAQHWPGQEGTFEAYWSVTGNVHILEFQNSGTAAAGSHLGTVTVQSNQGPVRAFETDCVAFADDEMSLGRCVWTGPMGDLVFVELRGTGLAGFGATRGKFVGGTGKYQGVEGGFQFDWNYSVSRGKDATFDGYSLEMRGNYRKP